MNTMNKHAAVYKLVLPDGTEIPVRARSTMEAIVTFMRQVKKTSDIIDLAINDWIKAVNEESATWDRLISQLEEESSRLS